MKPLTFEDGTRKAFRFFQRTGEAFHYLGCEEPVTALCGRRPERPDHCLITSDHYSNGKPIPICGHCRRRAEKAEETE